MTQIATYGKHSRDGVMGSYYPQLTMTDRIDRLNQLIQNQISTIETGYVRAVVSVELVGYESYDDSLEIK